MINTTKTIIAIIAPLPIKHLFQMPILANGGVIINNLFVHKGTKWYNYVRYAINDINLEREFLYEKENFINKKPNKIVDNSFEEEGDLYQKICQLKKMRLHMQESDVWRIFIQMVKGLKCLHDLKILHRDLKSANIFLFNDGSAKIGDCNVSKVVRKGFGYTQTGTPYYASPEVWSDDPYDSKSDIWSLGCITYEMLNLHPPFRADNME